MHILRWIKNKTDNQYIFDTTNPKLYFLANFFMEFNYKYNTNELKDSLTRFLEDSSWEDFLCNESGTEKIEGGKLAFFNLYGEDTDDLVMDVDVVFKIIDIYSSNAVEPFPQEIIITFDDDLRNPSVETIQ
jgi:hypothetical protein